MAINAQILMGSNESDYDWLQKNKTGSWSCLKETKKGDLLFFYFTKPHCAIVASAIASDDAGPDKKWRYRVGIKNIEMLLPGITLDEMLGKIPEWNWAKSPRHNTYLKESIAKKLLKLAHRKGQQAVAPTIRITATGAGFGSTPEEIRIVERAACEAVKLHFEKIGYEIVSRESEKLGYDFDACRNGEELHIEVKGVSSSILKFLITANEVACAKTDSKFRLAVVTEAKTKKRKVHIFSRKDFLKNFMLTPLAYFAEAKKRLHA